MATVRTSINRNLVDEDTLLNVIKSCVRYDTTLREVASNKSLVKLIISAQLATKANKQMDKLIQRKNYIVMSYGNSKV